ncbi:MAG: hypothetical protein A2086_14065 [Spirochaetes bacterium GWD1_27_9]|nr:MAG: hypothetical protein A2Z98_09665 [Spirochaetes bacterium GWB1_27_13]OHD21334.1 MAG: hypothetical protein A2Y34_10425 [Spirochaetes bacterium GWC1_27_15]OHD35397.1 MAG: hypothetical protein A2086_14065 [Spirochaetes bacterium GWD1_27_9]
MNKCILIIILILTSILFLPAQYIDIDKKTILTYYNLINNKELLKAYELSPKKVNFKIFKSWYENIENLQIGDILSNSDYKTVVTIKSKDKNNYVYDKYYVYLKVNEGKIIDTISTHLQHIENDNLTLENYELLKFTQWSSKEFDINHYGLVFNDGNVWETDGSAMVQPSGIYIIIGDEVNVRWLLGSNIDDCRDNSYYKIVKDKNLLKSSFKLISIKKDKNKDIYKNLYLINGFVSDGDIRNFNNEEFIVKNYIRNFNFSDKACIYNDFKTNTTYEYSFYNDYLKTNKLIKSIYLNDIEEIGINKRILGYKIVNNCKWYLINCAFYNYDINNSFDIYIKNTSTKLKTNCIVGWVMDKDIIF